MFLLHGCFSLGDIDRCAGETEGFPFGVVDHSSLTFNPSERLPRNRHAIVYEEICPAFENVSNTLYALQSDADTLAAQDAAERSAADSLALVQAQYKSGASSYVQVLTSEQSYQTAAVALVKARAQRYADTAALFQALGGGWWNRKEALADISATAGSRQTQ